MGIGAAYSGLIDLLGRHGKESLTVTPNVRFVSNMRFFTESCTDDSSPIRCVISFVAENALQSVKRPADDYIGNWYHQVSHNERKCSSLELMLLT